MTGNDNHVAGFIGMIPASVRYDKALCPGAKLLYCEISALTKKSGICYAENDYFAELFDVDKCTISRWVTQLKKREHIDYKLDKAGGNKRYITLLIKSSIPPCGKSQDPRDEKVKSYYKDEEFNKFKKAAFTKLYQTYPKRVAEIGATEAYEKLLKKSDNPKGLIAKIQAAVEAQVATGMLVNNKYTPQLATWLTKQRYEDEIAGNNNTPPANRGADGLTARERYYHEERKKRPTGQQK